MFGLSWTKRAVDAEEDALYYASVIKTQAEHIAALKTDLSARRLDVLTLQTTTALNAKAALDATALLTSHRRALPVVAEKVESAEAVAATAMTAQARAEAAEAAIRALHTAQTRVGSYPLLDPVLFTAAVRSVVSSIKVESDGKRMVFYTDRTLTEAERNALVSLLPAIDWT